MSEQDTNTQASMTDADTTRDGAENAQQNSQPKPPAPSEQPRLEGRNLILVALGLFLALICYGLDRSIVATATPNITSEFNSLPDVGWYGSAYLLTTCCFQLPFGKLFAELNQKWVFLASLLIFEVGSVVCAAAPSSVALIVGRAVSGIGGAGMVAGTMIILGTNIPNHQKPKWFAAIGAVVGVSQSIGPLIGGVFAGKVTWRWCFWINLPLGGVTALVILFFLRLPPKPNSETQTVRDLADKLDVLGTLILIPSIVCLLLALQWGGTQYPWSNWRCILLLCLFGVLFLLWGYHQYRRGDRATVPLRILKQRSVAFGNIYTLCGYAAIFILIYYVPIWFQAVRGVSAYQSGINMITIVAAWAVTSFISGFLTVRIGYYVPQMILSSIVMSIMAGLITTYSPDSTDGFWIATLIVFGFGVGVGGQQPIVAVQTVLKGADIALGTSILMFLQVLSGAIMLSVGENIFQQKLISNLAALVPEVDPNVVISSGANNLAQSMGAIYNPDEVHGIVLAYNRSLQNVFIIAVVLACLTSVGSAGMEWKSVKKPKPAPKDAEKASESQEAEKSAGNGVRENTASQTSQND